MLTLAYQCSICSFNLLFKIKRSSRVYTPMAPVFLLVLSLFIYLSSRSVIQTGNRNDAFLKREKRLANTVAWILLILVLTYFPGLLFGGVLVAKGVIIIFPFGLITSFLCNWMEFWILCLMSVVLKKSHCRLGYNLI